MKSDNELIAEFLGIRWHENGTVSHYPSVLPMRMGEDYVGDLKFHTSWDWLMPVVEKIFMLRHTEMRMSVGSLEIKSMPYKNGGLYFTISVCEPTLTGIQCYHKAVVEFIKWYNENKLTT